MNRRTFVVGALAGGAAAIGTRSVGVGARRRAPLVFVTADTEAHVAVVDAATGRIVRRIGTLEQPRSIERVAGHAVVAHSEQGRLTLIDTETLARRLLPARLGEPRYTAGHPDNRHAFVTDSGTGEILVLDVPRGRIVARVDVGGPARHLAIDPTGRRLWAALGSKAARIAVVNVADPRRPRLARHISPPFLAHDVVFSPDGRRVWVSSGDRGSIAIYDARSRDVVHRIAAMAPPQHLAFSERGRVAYVASGDDGSLRVHDLGGKLLTASRVPVGSYNVTRGAGHVVTPSLQRGTLCLLDRNGSVQRTVRIAAAAHDACVA